MRRLGATLLLTLGLVTPASAARPASGKWAGTADRSTATTSFSVDHGRTHILRLVVRTFRVFCTSTDDSSFDTWSIPSIRIYRDGHFARTYRPEKNLTLIARGRFTSAGRLRGHLEEQAAGGYCVGGLPWRAHHRG